MSIFEVATKEKYRFPYKGLISVEDLWDLTAAQLDGIYKTLNAEKKTAQEESLLAKRTKEEDALLTKLEIVKYIFAQKQAEVEERKHQKENAEKRQRILEIIANKQDAALQDKSVEDLQKMLEELG